MEYSPCIASIADIASSPSGHKICRTSLATLVMFRTPNSALHRFVCSVPHRPIFSLPLPTDLPSSSIDTNRVHATFSHTYAICTHVRRNDPISMHLYVVSAISPNYFESNLIETITFRSISHDPAEYIYAPSLPLIGYADDYASMRFTTWHDIFSFSVPISMCTDIRLLLAHCTQRRCWRNVEILFRDVI